MTTEENKKLAWDKELVRSYLTISKDLARVMTKVKAPYYYQLLDALRFLRQQSSRGRLCPNKREET